MAEAQKLVAHTAGSPENIQQAKAGAESAIRGLYSELGWQAAVTWAEGGNAARCHGSAVASGLPAQSPDSQRHGGRKQ